MSNIDLAFIEKIRRFRRNKRKKLSTAIEHALNSAQQKLILHDEDVFEKRSEFVAEKAEMIGEMSKGTTSLSALLTLQRKEKLHGAFIKNAQKLRNEQELLVANKKNDYQKSLNSLWEAEKKLMKLEEFINSEKY
jgi:hypothetical protein